MGYFNKSLHLKFWTIIAKNPEKSPKVLLEEIFKSKEISKKEYDLIKDSENFLIACNYAITLSPEEENKCLYCPFEIKSYFCQGMIKKFAGVSGAFVNRNSGKKDKQFENLTNEVLRERVVTLAKYIANWTVRRDYEWF